MPDLVVAEVRHHGAELMEPGPPSVEIQTILSGVMLPSAVAALTEASLSRSFGDLPILVRHLLVLPRRSRSHLPQLSNADSGSYKARYFVAGQPRIQAQERFYASSLSEDKTVTQVRQLQHVS